MKLFLIGFCCLALLVALILVAYNEKGTVYISGGMGVTMITSGENPVHHVTDTQFAEVIDRFLPGNKFDTLWVSRQNDQYGGLMLCLHEHKPVISVYLFTEGQASQIKTFGQGMKAAGYDAQETPGGFNGGFDEENRQTDFNISLPSSSKAVIKAVDTALAQLQPADKQGYYLNASRTDDLPKPGQGIVYRPPSDPLNGILR